MSQKLFRVSKEKCGTLKNDLTIRDNKVIPPILTGANLDAAVALAQIAPCENPAEQCCHKDDIKIESERKCTQIDGHRYLLMSIFDI